MQLLVLDTNVALDLLVFRDPSAAALDQGLASGALCWIATAAMRAEFERVLGYAPVASRLARSERTAQQALDEFDARSRLVDVAPVSSPTCSDPDDQPFIDLAVQHRCLLLTNDAAVLALRRPLAAMQVTACAVLPAASYSLSEAPAARLGS
jgi:predicted nucleic acid-binding protein